MADTFSKKDRSQIMSAVKSKGNVSTELKLIKIFKTEGIKGWRRNYPLFGNPDFVFPKIRVAIFADGCFWHGHDCRNTRPKDNAGYWQKKRSRNQTRDKLVTETLLEKGWKVFRVWECEISKKDYSDKLKLILSDTSKKSHSIPVRVDIE